MGKNSAGSSKKTDITGDLSYSVDTCARCGFCKPVCTTYPFGNGFEAFSPRAKVHYIKQVLEGKQKLTPEWVDRLYQCTTCERCVENCQTEIPLVHLWEELRAETVRQGIGPMPMHVKMREAVDEHNNPYGEPIQERDNWMEPEHSPSEGAELLVFGGCTGSYRMTAMLRTGVTILQRMGIPYAYAGPKEMCCGSPIIRTGQLESASRLIGSNLDLFEEMGIKEIVSPCSGCSKTIKADYPLLAEKLGKKWSGKVKHFSELYVELLRDGRIKPTRSIERTATYHDPCHLGRAQRIFDEPREILRAIPGLKLVEMEFSGENGRCCGAGGGVKGHYPEMAEQIADKRVLEAVETGADLLVTMCPFCQASFTQSIDKLGVNIELIGVEELLLQSVEG